MLWFLGCVSSFVTLRFMPLILKKLPVCYKILVTKGKICTGFNFLEVMLQIYKVSRTLAGDKLEVFGKIYYSPSKSSVYERVLYGNCLRTGPKEFFFVRVFKETRSKD